MTNPETSSLRVFVASSADILTDHLPHGEGLIAWATLSALARRGHDLVVCARQINLRDDPPFEVIQAGRASRWESIEPIAYAKWAYRAFLDHGGTRRFDAVHWLFPQDPLCFRPPAGCTFTVGPWSSHWSPKVGERRPTALGDVVRTIMTPYLARLQAQAFSRAESILLSTPYAIESIPTAERERAVIVPFGVDPARFLPGPLPDTPMILYAGRLSPLKGVRELIEGFAQALNTIPNACLTLAGEGPERVWITRRTIELGIEDHVRLLGPVDHAEMPNVMKTCSVLCLPARGEPFGMVVLEAMACGKAVIAPDDGGPGWLVTRGTGNRVLRSGTGEEVSDAIVETLADTARLVETGRRNREIVEAEFTLDRLARSLEGAYASDKRQLSVTANRSPTYSSVLR